MNDTEPKQKEGMMKRDSVINLSRYYHTHLFIDSIFFPYLSRSTDYDRDESMGTEEGR